MMGNRKLWKIFMQVGFPRIASFDIFQDQKLAASLFANSEVDRASRHNSNFFEEWQAANFERECLEQRCNMQELLETTKGQKNLLYHERYNKLYRRCWIEPCHIKGTEIGVSDPKVSSFFSALDRKTRNFIA